MPDEIMKGKEVAFMECSKPATTEIRIAGIWAEALECSAPVSVDGNFFALGGDSLAMMMMLFRVGEEFQIEALPSLVLDEPATLRGFCLRLDQLIVERQRQEHAMVIEAEDGQWLQGTL